MYIYIYIYTHTHTRAHTRFYASRKIRDANVFLTLRLVGPLINSIGARRSLLLSLLLKIVFCHHFAISDVDLIGPCIIIE